MAATALARHAVPVTSTVTPAPDNPTGPWPVHRGDLLLRDPVTGDADALWTIRSDARVNAWMVRTDVEESRFRDELAAIPTSDLDHSCVLEVDGAPIGIGFLEIVDGSGQPGHPTGTDALIGYLIDPAHHGRGYGAATGAALVQAAFEVLRVRRVTAYAYADNPASVRILERAGLRKESHCVRALWHAQRGWVDEVGFGLLREEWESAR